MAKNYLTEVEEWFERQLAIYLDTGETDVFKKAVKDKILESYRNGKRAGARKEVAVGQK